MVWLGLELVVFVVDFVEGRSFRVLQDIYVQQGRGLGSSVDFQEIKYIFVQQRSRVINVGGCEFFFILMRDIVCFFEFVLFGGFIYLQVCIGVQCVCVYICYIYIQLQFQVVFSIYVQLMIKSRFLCVVFQGFLGFTGEVASIVFILR